MKQFIVLAAILPIMLLFVSQATLEGVRGLRMSAAEDAVRAFCIEAAYFDGGGAAEADALRSKLARIFRTDPGEVFLSLAKPDSHHVEWSLSFPVGDVMAGARLMGLSDAENRGRAEMRGVIVIAPKPPPPQEGTGETENNGREPAETGAQDPEPADPGGENEDTISPDEDRGP